MAKNNPLIDGILAGTALSAVADKSDPSSGSKVLMAGVLTAYRSAQQNEEARREEGRAYWAQHRAANEARAAHAASAALANENAHLRSQLNSVEQQANAAQSAQETVAAVRKFIIDAEEWLAAPKDHTAAPMELTLYWVMSKAFERNLDHAVVGLDELRALAEIRKNIADQSVSMQVRPNRIAATLKGLFFSFADWWTLCNKESHSISDQEIDRAAALFAARQRRARIAGALSSTTNEDGALNFPDGTDSMAALFANLYPISSAACGSAMQQGDAFDPAAIEALKEKARAAKANRARAKAANREAKRKQRERKAQQRKEESEQARAAGTANDKVKSGRISGRTDLRKLWHLTNGLFVTTIVTGGIAFATDGHVLPSITAAILAICFLPVFAAAAIVTLWRRFTGKN